MPDISIVRSLKVENEEYLTGLEVSDEDLNENIDMPIPATTEEGIDIGGFRADQLKSLILVCDQNVTAQFLGVRYAILACVAETGTTAAEVTFTGDLSGIVFPGDVIRLQGTAANDGYYVVNTVTWSSPTTTFELAGGETLATAGAVGTLAIVQNFQRYRESYTIVSATTGPPGTITFTGNLTHVFNAGDYLIIENGTITTETSKNAIYLIDTVACVSPTTTITFARALLADENDGDFRKVRVAMQLLANIPFLWSVEGGLPNPLKPQSVIYTTLQGEVDVLYVYNATSTAATLKGRIGKNSIL